MFQASDEPLPVRFQHADLSFENLGSSIKRYEQSYYLLVSGVLQAPKHEIRKLDLRLRIIARDGSVFHESIKSIQDDGVRAYAGVEIPVYIIMDGDPATLPDLAHAELEIDAMTALPGTDEGFSDRIIPMSRGEFATANLSLAFQEKEVLHRKGSSTDYVYLYTVLTNNGTRPITSAMLEARWSAGGSVTSSKRYLVSSTDPILHPGRSRPLCFIADLPPGAGPGDYTVRILTIE